MKSNTTARILVFVLGIPAGVASAFALPEAGFPLFALLVIVASALGARELAAVFSGSMHYPGRAVVVPLIGAAAPTLAFMTGTLAGGAEAAVDAALLALTAGVAMVALGFQVTRRRPANFGEIAPSVGAHLVLFVYPGLFASFALRLTLLPSARALIIVLLLSTYLNDSAAWACGRLFARRSAGVAVSPNKSRIGFAGGLTASIVVFAFGWHWAPAAFPFSYPIALGFGAIIGCGVIIGDLAESALKRSVGLRDSGSMVPGRGGVLDSIDSPLYTAPLLYYGYRVIGTLGTRSLA